jgi:curved DNA-binding protein
MAFCNCPYDPSVDYFAVLGVHQQACSQTVKQAYRRLARRYHPDVSKIHDAQRKFQEIAEAYEILSKYRDAYWRDFQTSQTPYTSKTHARRSYDGAAEEPSTQERGPENASSFYSGAYRHQKPIDGKDRVITYPLTLRYAIRLLRLGSFYIPGLKVRMKFTREALMGKTFRLAGKGYSGLFGGKPGDFLVRFNIKQESLKWQLKGADLYGVFQVARPLLVAGKQIRLEAPSGSCMVEVPANYSPDDFIRIDNMGLPPDEQAQAGHLYARLIAA